MKKKVAKVPYEGYTLPKSSEKGVNFIDFNASIEEDNTEKGKDSEKEKIILGKEKMSKGEPIPYDDALRIAKKHLIQIGL